MNSHTSLLTTLLIIFFAGLYSPFAFAQEGNVADAWVLHIKEGNIEKFEIALKKHMAMRERANDPFNWKTYVAFVGDDIGHYVVRSCCTTWAAYDDYDQWNNNNNIGDHWNKNVDRYVMKYRHFLETVDYDNSNWPEDESNIRFVGVRSFEIKPGRSRSLYVVKNRMSKAAKAGNWDRHWAWLDSSGGIDTLVLASPFESYADMEPPDTHFLDFLAEQLGSSEEAQKAWTSFADSYTHSKYTVYRYMPELSSTTEK